MAVPPKDRRPKAAVNPPARQIKTGGDPANYDTQTPGWQFSRVDLNHPRWGWKKLDLGEWLIVLRFFQALEGLSWADIKRQSGGRTHGTNHHALEIDDFRKEARDRWTALRLTEYDSVFSLRIHQTLRLYGVRDNRVFRIVWHDPCHGSGDGAYPTKN